MELRYQASGRNGYEPIITNSPDLNYLNEFGILRLGAGEVFDRFTGDCEAMLHIVEGRCSVEVGDDRFDDVGGRSHPFSGRPEALYLPPQTAFSIHCAESVEATLTFARSEGTGRARAIRAGDLESKVVGKENWQRTVTMIATPEFPSQKLILGETVNPPGNWSGVPAHKHDAYRQGVESLHEELYYFRADRPGGWGLLRIYDKAELDEMILLVDRTVALIPRGYHTVSAAPGYTLYYTFFMAGPEKEVQVFVDPDQAWIND